MKKLFTFLLMIYLVQSVYYSQDKHLVNFNHLSNDINSNININKNSVSNHIDTADYSKIILGREQLSGWELFSPIYNIWKTDLDREPKKVLGNKYLNLIKNSDSNYNLWRDSSWYWESNILYMKDNNGNPDSTYNNINAVCGGGWKTTSGYFNKDEFPDVAYSDAHKIFIHYGGSLFSARANRVLSSAGFHLANAGDINGDGCDELISSLEWGKDTVYLYIAGALGLDDSNKIAIVPPEGYLSYGFGHSVSKAPGDINGDGFNDILIGSSASYFCIYFGSSQGIQKQPNNIFSTPDSAVIGASMNLSFIGDINNDGFDDIAASCANDSNNIIKVYVFFGSHDGLNYYNYKTLNFEIDSSNVYRVASIAKAGDINGDGIDDLLIGNEWHDIGAGEAYIYYGSPAGIGNTPDRVIENPFKVKYSNFGEDLNGIDDFNDDGFNDIIIGCPYKSNLYGEAYIYFGSTSGVSNQPNIILTEGQSFGWSSSKVGNILGDDKNYIMISEEYSESYLITYNSSPVTVELKILNAPNEFILYQNYPNPFNPYTTIKYALPFESSIEVRIYNIIGQKIEEFSEGIKGAGYHDIIWQPKSLSSGVYLYSIIAKSTDGKNNLLKTKKMLYLK